MRALALSVALLSGGAAVAQGYATRTIGAWTVSPSSDGQGCFITRTYPAPRETVLQFGLDVDGGNRLTLLNANWSIRARERLKLDFRLSNVAFPRHLAIGIVAEGKKGFVTSFGAAFPRYLATSASIHIRRGAVPVEELSLDGSGPAIAALRSCVDQHRPSRATRRTPRQDIGRIPLDPFARKADSRK